MINGFPAFVKSEDGMTIFERLFAEYKNYEFPKRWMARIKNMRVNYKR